MNARQLTHPWQLATMWTSARRSHAVVVTIEAPSQATPATHWWTPHTLPENRSHYYPSRYVYLESSELSRMMDHL
jgi:hypothetical protein